MKPWMEVRQTEVNDATSKVMVLQNARELHTTMADNNTAL
jgi:hypothetical protein